jgi:aspartyl-tRNA(Asn)/glutamyl-tRNA(Gln) amidotransferase subunit A
MSTATAAGSIEGVRSAIAKGETTAKAVVEIYQARIAGEDEKIHAFLSTDRDYALAQAARIDDLAAKGDPLPKLAGVPFGIKDVLTLEGFAATAGSKILEGYRPPYTATAVKKLADAGAVFLGKLNCDEFAMGSSNENSAYGPVHNPHDLDRVPGGSSGGSAAAVAAGMAVATLGTDTGGSIRQPASFCGVVGVLPTYGRVSRYGLIAFASSLDRIGPFAATVRDAATVLGVIAGNDVMDATSSSLPVPDYTETLDKSGSGREGDEARRACGVLRGGSRRRSASRDRGWHREAARGGRGDSEDFASAYAVCDSDVLRDCDGGGQFEPGTLRWRALRAACAAVRHAGRDVSADARPGIRR